MKKNNKLLLLILSTISILLFVFVWIVYSKNNPILIPSPHDVYLRFISTFTNPIAKVRLPGHIFSSLVRVLIGLLLSWIIGIFLGVLIGWSDNFKALFGSVLELLRPIPPIAWIPIFILWFGIGELSKILLVFIGTVFTLIINTTSGINLVDPINVDVGRIFGGNKRQILFDIVIPTALPSIFAGLRTSTSIGWTTVVAAEMMGAKVGLGSLVTKGWQGNDMSLVLVAVICIAIIGIILSVVLQKLEKVLCPWIQM